MAADSSARSDAIRTVLLVGDAAWRASTADALATPDFRAVEADSAEAALGRLEDIDCVVSDWEFADGDAAALLARIRETAADLPFVLFTDDDCGPASRIVEAGVTDHVRKSAQPDALAERVLAAVERSCDEGSYRDIFEKATDGIFVHDAETGAILDVNPRGCEMYGRTPGEARAMGVGEMSAPDSAYSESRAAEYVRKAVEEGPQTFEWQGQHADGHTFWVEVDLRHAEMGGDDRVLAVVRDITDRKERERTVREQREHLENIVQNVPVAIYAFDADGRITLLEGKGLEALGVEPGELVGQNVFDVTSDYPEVVADLEVALDGGNVHAVRDVGDLTFEHIYQPLRGSDGQLESVIGISMDITARRRHERTLTALHRSTHELQHAETVETIAAVVVETAVDVLELTGCRVYWIDDEENVMYPLAQSSASEGVAGFPAILEPGRSIAWEVLFDDETVVFDDIRESEHLCDDRTPIRSGLFVPIGDSGVFVAGDERVGVFDEQTAELAELLMATASAAVDRVHRETELREREREMKRQRNRLERVNRVNEVIRDLNRALVGADSREAIERAVCERLTATDAFPFVWLGALDAQTDELAPRAWAGGDASYLDSVSLSAGENAEPVVRSAATEEPVVVSNVTDGLRAEPWRRAALSAGYQSVAAVPLCYDEFCYGVVGVYADAPGSFDDLLVDVLAELGETIAHAVNAVETKQALLADRVVELDLRVREPDDALVRLAAAADCEIDLVGAVSTPDDGTRMFFSVSDTPPDSVVEAASRAVSVEQVRHVTDRDGEHLFEAVVAAPTIAATLAEYGGVTRSVRTDGEEARVVVELPQYVDVRQFLNGFRRSHPKADLMARRDRERPPRTRQTFRAAVADRLTDRQYEVLRTAYYGGFFDWPRASTGEETAASLGITQPTFNRHLRTSERKLLALLFDE